MAHSRGRKTFILEFRKLPASVRVPGILVPAGSIALRNRLFDSKRRINLENFVIGLLMSLNIVCMILDVDRRPFFHDFIVRLYRYLSAASCHAVAKRMFLNSYYGMCSPRAQPFLLRTARCTAPRPARTVVRSDEMRAVDGSQNTMQEPDLAGALGSLDLATVP